jgi:hypothetical protein
LTQVHIGKHRQHVDRVFVAIVQIDKFQSQVRRFGIFVKLNEPLNALEPRICSQRHSDVREATGDVFGHLLYQFCGS